MTISVSSSVLLSYLQAKTGQDSASGSSTVASQLAASAPVAPWSSAATITASSNSYSTSLFSTPSTSTNTLVEQILAGKNIVDPTQQKLSQTTSSDAANTDYQNLFALYQGLTTLQSLATAASASTTTSSQLKLIEQAFTSGLGQVRSFISGDPFDEFAVSDGTISSTDMTSVGVQQASDTYDSAPLVKVSPNDVVQSLTGDVAFSMTATNLQGQPTTVNFNLDDMGSTPRTLSNVVTYLNSQLSAAGLKTRFATNLFPGQAAVTTTSNGVTTTVAAATPDQYGLQINGTPNEMLSFSAASTTPAVYIAQTSYDPAATTTSSTTTTTTTSTTLSTSTSGTSTTAATVTSQFIKLDQPDADGDPTTRGFTDSLPTGSTVTATATAPDGSVYVLANVTQATNGQSITGEQDAALFKYDSAGQLVYTRTLGSTDTVDATALAVSADGSQVAIAGSVTGGAIDPTDTTQDGSTTQQSFVTVYDGDGDQLWDYTQDGNSDNQANSVAFGADDSVYIAGQTMGRLPGATASGSQDGFVQGFNVTASTDRLTKETSYTATSAFTQEFGTSGIDRATGVAVSGSSVYVSSVENGDAVVRQFNVTSSTSSRQVNTYTNASTTTHTATQVAQQDLGALTGGNVSGIAVAEDGSVLVAGSTHDANLNAGTITSAYSGNGDAFVARLSGGIGSTADDSLAYYNTGQPTTATALTVDGNTAYITGQINGQSTTTPALGYAAAIDPTTGQVGWSTTFTGNNGSADPSSIAVSDLGASVLDKLGLPQGALQQQNTPSQLLVANTSVQAGDFFYVQTGAGQPQKVTIAADDTYATLAQKIKVASGYNATVTTMTLSSGQQLKIAPATSTASIRIEAGTAGQDALASLGLKEGLVSSSATGAAPTTLNGAKVTSNIKSHYSVTVPDSLSLSTSDDIKAAQSALATAIADVQSIYTDMTSAKPTGTANTGGTAPAYITAQISNYKLALSRLTGSSSSSSSSGSYSASSAALAMLGG